MYCISVNRFASVDDASPQEPSVRGDVPGCVHGTHDRLRLRGVPAQVPGDAVQPRQESGQRFYR